MSPDKEFRQIKKLHQFDTKKMQKIREAILRPGSVHRRKEFVEMDRTLLHFCRNSPFHTDRHIAIFLQAISLALKQLLNDLVDTTEAENVEEIGDDDEENEREIEVENEVDAENLHVSPLHLPIPKTLVLLSLALLVPILHSIWITFTVDFFLLCYEC